MAKPQRLTRQDLRRWGKYDPQEWAKYWDRSREYSLELLRLGYEQKRVTN